MKRSWDFLAAVRKCSVGTVLAAVFLWPLAGQCEPVLPYFPFDDGSSWTYLLNGSPISATITGTEIVNGVATKVLTRSSGDKQYWTNDAFGIRLHRQFFVFGPETDTYSPPIVISGPDATPGASFMSSGTVTAVFDPCGSVQLPYSASSSVLGFELISVPAGLFNTIRTSTQVSASGTIYCPAIYPFPISITVTSTEHFWAARGVGTVRGFRRILGPTSS